MKYIGLILMLSGALLISREYSKYIKKRIAECEAFLSLIKYMKNELHCYMKPPREILKGYSNDAIEPFLSSIGENNSLICAYRECEESFSLSNEERETVAELFSGIGLCYFDEGERLMESAYCRLSELHSDLVVLGAKQTRLVATLSAAFAVGIFILVI